MRYLPNPARFSRISKIQPTKKLYPQYLILKPIRCSIRCRRNDLVLINRCVCKPLNLDYFPTFWKKKKTFWEIMGKYRILKEMSVRSKCLMWTKNYYFCLVTVSYTQDTLTISPLANPIDVDPAVTMRSHTLEDTAIEDCSQNYTAGKTMLRYKLKPLFHRNANALALANCWAFNPGGGGRLGINLDRMCVSKSEGYGSLFGFKRMK